jgi:nicotinamidase-related amidase
MNVIPLHSNIGFSGIPFIAFVDLQVEYITDGRVYCIRNVEPWIENCQRLLDGVRQLRLPLAHFRQMRSSVFFNEKSDFCQWIKDFRPRANEAIYERQLPSCYSNKAFCEYIDHVNQPIIVLAGLTADQSCLSTVVEAYHRNHHVIYVSDASSNPPLGKLSEEESHKIASEIISLYAEVTTTDEILGKLQSIGTTALRGYK